MSATSAGSARSPPTSAPARSSTSAGRAFRPPAGAPVRGRFRGRAAGGLQPAGPVRRTARRCWTATRSCSPWRHGKHLFLRVRPRAGPARPPGPLWCLGFRRRRHLPRRVQHRRAPEGGGAGGVTTTAAATPLDVRRQRSAYAGPPAPVGAVRVRLAGGARLGGPAGRDHVRGDHGGGGRRPSWRGSVRTRCGTCPATGTPSPPRWRRKRTPLAALLMDQKVIAGVGNVYRAELLFRQRLNPWLPGGRTVTGRGPPALGRHRRQ